MDDPETERRVSRKPRGFVDLQVNGYAGVDFNSDKIDQTTLHQVVERLRHDRVEQILITIITAPLADMIQRIRMWVRLLSISPFATDIIAGMHIEGPFLSPVNGFVGAHPVDAVRPADLEIAQKLIDSGEGHIRIITLAPEQDPDARVTQWLTNQGIVVAAGHSDATLVQLKQSIDRGLKLFTHLGNACPNHLPRHDNIIQRVLSLSDRLSISFIADGHHVPSFALQNYLQVIPTENIIIVTDAMAAAGMGPGRYQLSSQTVEVDESGAAWSADRTHFAGSAATMPDMAQRLSEQMGIAEANVQQWMSDNPRKLIA